MKVVRLFNEAVFSIIKAESSRFAVFFRVTQDTGEILISMHMSVIYYSQFLLRKEFFMKSFTFLPIALSLLLAA